MITRQARDDNFFQKSLEPTLPLGLHFCTRSLLRILSILYTDNGTNARSRACVIKNALPASPHRGGWNGSNRHNFARIALKSAISGFDQWFLLIVLKILFSPTLWSIEKFPIDPCPPQHKKPPSRERRRKSSQRESLATPLESIICPLELAGESYRRVWGDYLCSSPMVFQLCLASSAPSLNGFRLLTSASFFTSCCVDFQSIHHVTRGLPVIPSPAGVDML